VRNVTYRAHILLLENAQRGDAAPEAPVRIFLPLDPPGVSHTSRPAPANSAIARMLLLDKR
jgi:hypothetical protein